MNPHPYRFILFSFIGAALLATVAFAAVQPEAASTDPRVRAMVLEEFDVHPSLEIIPAGSPGFLARSSAQSFLSTYSDRWEMRWDTRSDRPNLVQGIGIPLIPGLGNRLQARDVGFDMRSASVHDVDSQLQVLLRDPSVAALLRVEGLDLRLNTERSHSYGAQRYFWSMEYQQYQGDVPVVDARIFFRINHGNVVQFGAEKVSEITVDSTAAFRRERALRAAQGIVETNSIHEWLDRGSLEIIPARPRGETSGSPYLLAPGLGYEHYLVWRFEFRLRGNDHTFRLRVDAHSGEVLELLDLTRFAEVRGDIYPTTNTDPLVTVGFPFTEVSNSGTKITDADGNYSYSGGTATAQLDGRYVNINDNCGSISLSNSTDGTLDFGGSGGTDCTTPGVGGSGNTHAARSGFYHLTNINRKAATFLPGNSWLNGTLTANMNINNTCNAFWNGSTVNFYRSGGGCSNTGELAAVFLHEWGHGMDENAGGTASDQGTGEAVGDIFAFLETRRSCIGDNFIPGQPCHNCGSCTGVRDMAPFALGGSATIARPDTVGDNAGINCDRFTCPYLSQGIFPYQGPMGYEGHCEAVIAGAAGWDLTQMLITEYGTDPGWAAMDSIWYGSLTAAGSAYRVASGGKCNPSASVDGCASDNWYTLFLSVDDDDGNLGNGTPNGCRIWDAFDAHGIACGSRPDCSTTCTPTPIADAGADQSICAGESASIGSAAQGGHSYSWSPGGQTSSQISVSPASTTLYTVTATTTCGSANDSVTVTVDSGGGGGMSDDFESGGGSWTTTGLWHLTSNSSCASPGYSSATSAMYYGQDSGCNYDAGDNTGDLISSAINGINSTSELSFDYFRQVEDYAGGSYDQAQVAVSVAGSGSWTTVWSRDSGDASASAWTASGAISLAAFAGDSIQVRFRFDSIDGSYNTFTGWFIDDVVVTADSPCGGNTAPTVSITAPADGTTVTEGDTVNFAGTASDVEDGSLTASLAWTSSMDGPVGSGGSPSSSTLSVGFHTITASVTDSGGLGGSDAIGLTVQSAVDNPPTVTITAPADGTSVTEGDTVNFTGTATDVEDDDTTLTAALSWTSSIDGAIGSGGSPSSNTLSVGTHTITASVTDSGGNPDSDSISLTVNPDTPGCADCVDWSVTGTVSYSNQDNSSNVTVEDGGDTLLLEDNTWRRTTQTFAVTANTVLEFEFSSAVQGEIHGIGFDENDTLSDDVRIFQVHGTQNWSGSNHDFDNYAGGGSFTAYSIPVGQYYTGASMYLVVVNDNDAGSGNDSRFRNVRIYETTPPACAADVDFSSGASGWTNSGSSTCSTGSFVAAVPTEVVNGGVTTQVGGDHTTGSGNAFFSATNTSAGSNDVDGGTCIVESPTYAVTESSNVSIWYFHGQRDAGDDAGDFFSLEISTNGGGTWSTMASFGDVTVNAAWTEATTTVNAGDNVRFRVQVADATGGGDLVEAGVDDLSICVP